MALKNSQKLQTAQASLRERYAQNGSEREDLDSRGLLIKNQSNEEKEEVPSAEKAAPATSRKR